MEPTGPTVEVKQNGISRADFLCWLALALVLAGAVVIRGRLLSIPLERDEGEYAYIAQQMLKGVPPYESAYSMKLPGIYVVYGLILTVFGQTTSAIHLGLLVMNAITILVVYLLTKKLFGTISGLAGAAAFAGMSLIRPVLGLSANAEQFVILPALAGILLVSGVSDKHRYLHLIAAGLLLGLAFVIKQHCIFLVLFAMIYLLYIEIRRTPHLWKKAVMSEVVFAAGVVAPFSLVCLLLWKAGAFEKFWFWTFTYARKYAAAVPLDIAPTIFWEQFVRLAESAWPLLGLALAGLISVFVSKSLRDKAVFTVGLLVFSFLCVCPGFYFRSHYFVFLLPAIAILAGAAFAGFNKLLAGFGPAARYLQFILIAILGLVAIGYSLFNQRAYLFLNTPTEVSRLIYGANPFAESPVIADFIRSNTMPDETIAVIGSEPQIYFYSGRRAATGYIYAYPLMEAHDYAVTMQKEMVREIETAKPKIIVFVNISSSWLSDKDSIMDIFQWFDSYINKFYKPVGIIEILPSSKTVYFWNEQASRYSTVADDWIAVFKRKD